MPMPVLPNELYRPILLHIVGIDRRKTLSSLALASRFLNSEAVPQLYHSFVEVDDPETQVLFFKAVSSSPRLARLVYLYVWDVRTRMNDQHEFWTFLPMAMRSFVNLKELGFRTQTRSPAAHILRDCTFQLTHFDWDNRSDEAGLFSFLSTQHSIKYLRVIWNSPEYPTIPSSVLRSLRSLCGDYKTIAAIMPQCSNLTSLFWQPDGSGEDERSDPVSPPFQNLRTFTFNRIISEPNLSCLALHLANLVRFHLASAHVDEYPHLLRLFNLEHLKLSLPISGEMALVPKGQEKEFTAKLFSAFKRLRIIDIQDTDPKSYQRWEKGEEEPIVVERDIFSYLLTAWSELDESEGW